MKKLIIKVIKVMRFYSLIMFRNVTLGKKKYKVKKVIKNRLAEAMADKNYELCVDVVFRTIFDIREGAFIDVGANIGQTLIKVISIDNDRQYIGFEPQIEGCCFIDKFIKDNSLNKYVIMPLGLSDKKGVLRLGLRESCDATASIVDKYRPEGFYSYYQYIPVELGDNILPTFGLSSISIIKIDVEGAELDVIRGLVDTINIHTPYIFFEVLPHYLFATRQELDEVTKKFRDQRHTEIEHVLKSHGYVIYQIRTDEGLHKVNVLKADKSKVFNYIAVPDKEEKDFIKNYPDEVCCN